MSGRSLLSAALCFASLASVGRADVVTDWNSILLDAIRTDQSSSPKAARAIAMMNLAMFDTINSFAPTYEEYLTMGTPGIGAVKDSSAVAAARRILSVIFPDQSATFDAAVDAHIGGLPGFVFEPSNTFGVSIANALLFIRDGDGSSINAGYSPGDGPGEWQPTPPGNEDAQLPNWPNVTPFALSSASQFRASGPPDLTSARYTADYEEARRYGSENSVNRSADQTEFAQFWNDGPGTATTPGHWIQIAIDIAGPEGNTVDQNARVFALIGLALADAGLCAWDSKYAYDDWRPITAIRGGLLDGNNDTDADLTWTPLLDTPPHPGYLSAQSAYSGAAARMMEIIYGKDGIGFTAESDSLDGVTRTYSSLSGAGEEAGFATVVGGQCFRYAHVDGLAAGQDIASYIHARFLTRLPADATGASACGGTGGCGLGGLFTMAGMLMALPMLRRSNRRMRR